MATTQQTLTLKRFDERPAVEDQLRDHNGDPIDLTNASSVTFFMRHERSDELVVNAAATIENAVEGRVSYAFAEGETGRTGRHAIEWEVVWPDGDSQTVPPDRHRYLNIHQRVAGDGSTAPLEYASATVSILTVDDHIQMQENPIRNAGVIDANQQLHGADITTDLETRRIAPTVADAGAAVNQAIADLSPAGGVIELPRGMVPCNTQIDFSNTTTNAQERGTPIILKGHGRQTDYNVTSGGSILDATNLAGSVIVQGGGIRENVVLRDFSIYNTDNTANAIHLGMGGNQWIRWVISNIAVRDGGAYGLYSEFGGYDSELSNIYVGNAQQGYYFYRPNTIDAHGLTARLCSASDYVVEIEGGFGYDIGPLYCESNDGGALQTWGNHRAAAIGPIYLEQNNRSATMASELRLGDDTLVNTADMRACEIGPVFGSTLANPVSGTRIHLSRVHFCNFRSVGDGGNRMDMLQDTRGDNIWQGCWLGAVDTSAAASGSTWIQNNIADTTNRNAGATVLSGS